MTIRNVAQRLRPDYYLGSDWHRPATAWVTGFHRGIDHGRRLWGVDDDLKKALLLLSDEDRQSALLAGATATRTFVAQRLGLVLGKCEPPSCFADDM